MDLYYPPADDRAWQGVDPRALGWNAGALDEMLAFARDHDTDQLVIVEDGRLAVNASFGCGPEAAGDVFAVQKAVFAVLLGIAAERRVLHVDDRLSDHLPAHWTRRLRAG